MGDGMTSGEAVLKGWKCRVLESPPRDLVADGGPNDLEELSPDMDNESLLELQKET